MSGRAVQREAVEALRSFGAACAALTRLGSALPKPLVQLVDAAHTLANVTAVRLEGKNPSVGDLACENRAWEDVARAQAGWPGQEAALRIPRDVAEGDVEPAQRHELIRR